MIKKILPIFIILFSISLSAQEEGEEVSKKLCNEDLNKKAIALYEKGINKKKYQKPERLEFLSKAIELEPDFAEANLRMGLEMIVRMKLNESSFSPTIPYFLAAIKSCPQVHSEPYYYVGFAYYEELKYDSAVKYLEKFIAFKDEDDTKFAKDYTAEIYQAKQMVKSVKKEKSLKRDVPFDPKVVKGVSTERDEYLAYISPDDKNCYFVRKVPKKDISKGYDSDKEVEKFMIAKRDKTGVFNSGELMGEPFNTTDDNQGGCSISIDNQFLYFAMMRHEGGSQPNVDIYVSQWSGEYWISIDKLSPTVNHPVYWDSQPTIAADGLTLYFASDRPGGYGGVDLWVTKKDPKTKQWSVPQNMGPTINTKGHEKTPFIHSDSETLYFASDGHYGFGGFDIFYTRKNEKGEWMEPENIGKPINDQGDDTGLFVSADTKTGYFFSFDEGKVRGRGIGRYDLYSFDLYQEARPQLISFISGDTKDKSGEAVAGAIVEIKNTATKEITHAVVDSTSGKWMAAISLKKKDNLIITVKKDSVAFNSVVLDMKKVTATAPPPPVKLLVEKTDKGKSFIMHNIHYKTNSAEVQEESKLVLESFADYLRENPNLTVEIQGHTDNVGNPKDNEALSTNRAFSVKQLIESFKIDGKRVSAKGYGQSMPITDNKTEAGRAENRRTEFLIIEH